MIRAVVALLILASSVQAQAVRVQFHSNNILQGLAPDLKLLEVETMFGLLKIPISEVRDVRLGCRYEAGQKELIEKAINAVNSTTYANREEAQKTLIAQGKLVLPFLVDPKDVEAKNRFKLIREAVVTADPNAEHALFYDTIQTDVFDIKGYIKLDAFDLNHADFGTIKVKLSKISSLNVKTNRTYQLTVPMTENVWTESKYRIAGATDVVITASGQVDLWFLTPGRHLSDPDGTLDGSMIQSKTYTQFKSGVLIAKIGQDGTPFQVGSRTARKLEGTGNLYFFIVEPNWGNSTRSGSYNVTIKGE